MNGALPVNIRGVIDQFLPVVVLAGRYARQIQRRVQPQKLKEQYDSLFGQALTDADLSVQGFLEVAALSICPEFGFFGEEFAHSLNMKYFPQDAEVSILVDPVDGTRCYKDGHDLFSVILSFVDRNWFLGSVVYVAAKDIVYFGVKGEGTFCIAGSDVGKGVNPKRVSLQEASTDKLLTYDLEWARSELSRQFEFIDIRSDYDPAGFDFGLPSLLEGAVGCMVRQGGSLIDWGAFAFLAQEAGGIATDFDGNSPLAVEKCEEYVCPSLLISANEKVHARALSGFQKMFEQRKKS